MKVLIAEDDPVSRRLLEAVLSKWGYTVETASNGRAAWEALEAPDAPSLVVSDWMMPGMDGLELCRRIRQREASGYTYFIILTANDAKEDVVRGLDAGADDYLVKPFDQEELKCRVRIGERILRLEQKILQLATTDPVTGLLNRRAIMEKIRVEVERAYRQGVPLSLAIVDIDHFKRINDTYGHQAGDKVLEAFAALLLDCSRIYDCVGRFGGEEFLLCLPGTTGPEALRAAERWRAAVEGMRVRIEEGPQETQITASFGVAALRLEADEDMEDLFRRADGALYRAKQNGRNRVEMEAVY